MWLTQAATALLPLGVLEKLIVAEASRFSLQPGDVVVLTSDGVQEAHAPGRSMFGMPRLLDLIAANRTQSAPEIVIRHKVVVLLAGLNRCSLVALQFARSLSRDVTAVIVDVDHAATAETAKRWKQLVPDVPLHQLASPYRSVIRPLMDYLDQVDHRERERGPAVVVFAEVVPARWWHHLLHNQTALLLKTVLLHRRSRSIRGKS